MEEKEKGGTQSLWEQIKSFFRRGKAWALEHPVRCAIGGTIFAPIFLVAVICMVEWKIPNPRAMDMDQWVSLLGGALAYVGTCFLGILAFWQNTRFKKENDRFQQLSVIQGGPALNLEVQESVISSSGARVLLRCSNCGKSVMLGLKILSLSLRVNSKVVEVEIGPGQNYLEQVSPNDGQAVDGTAENVVQFTVNDIYDTVIYTVKVEYFDAEGNMYLEETERTVGSGSYFAGVKQRVLGRRTISRVIKLAIDNDTCKFK